YKRIWVFFFSTKKITNKFWPRFIMKYYLFAKFYKKNTFFQNFWTFSFT
ncbi:unnamed protein product, partial [Staurois parvus]